MSIEKTKTLWSLRSNPARGDHFIPERQVTDESAQQWLEVFRKDEPGVLFVVSEREPAIGPNVRQILVQATRVVRGTIPRSVRNELMAAVKAGALGHLKKAGLKPEVFFHPDHKSGAVDLQSREAEDAVRSIAKVMAVSPVEVLDGADEPGSALRL